MSTFNFIASDTQLPEVDLTNVKRMTVKELKKLNPQARSPVPLDELDENLEVLYCESEEDMKGLTVSFCNNPPYNLDYHIKKKYVYWLRYDFTEKSTEQLMEYLQKNIKEIQQVEVWAITFGNKDDIYKVKDKRKIKLLDLTKGDLIELNSQGICIQISY
ncbi:hypothetical protein JMF89_09615 [Clostridiaceae bacterium UIB06]|uniref:Uncharacterized protein n=1 Tax=Clostridium thailandense TaxID=2794346 RepID=A0A949TZL5_9CLOT|nr:hypothetical protein [Clostridium thailandense]MBV7273763.1 hypothetical protein [Clostridium thailandense]MCH5137457.1 hypothetical protein [Clostridiaceae bacterium UIB06]